MRAFSLLAIVTSTIGFVYGLVDFFADIFDSALEGGSGGGGAGGAGGAEGGGGGGGAGDLLTLAVPSYFEIGDVLARLERASKSLPRRRRVKLYD